MATYVNTTLVAFTFLHERQRVDISRDPKQWAVYTRPPINSNSASELSHHEDKWGARIGFVQISVYL